MDEILTAVKTIKRQDPTSLNIASARQQGDAVKKLDKPPGEHIADHSSPEYILGVLKSNPSRAQLSEVLHILDFTNRASTFDIRIPTSRTAQILHVLVNTTIPDFWNSLQANTNQKASGNPKTKNLRGALLRCLCSVAGINAIIAQQRSLITALSSFPQVEGGHSRKLAIRDMVAILSALIEPKDSLLRLYMDISTIFENDMKKQIAWKELVSLVAPGRILSTAAEALMLVKGLDGLESICWVGEGTSYASWLGLNLYTMTMKIGYSDQEGWKFVGLMTGRALSLGYKEQLVRELYSGLIHEQDFSMRLQSLFKYLRASEQTSIFESVLHDVEKTYFSKDLFVGENQAGVENEFIGGVATLCSNFTNGRPSLESQLQDWLSKGQGGFIQSIWLRRALIVIYSNNKDALTDLFTKSLRTLGDKLYIKHTPIRVQEANAQVVLLLSGYLHRLNPSAIKEVGRSSLYLNAISNRLAASSTEARFLGMIVGMAISRLTEPAGNAIQFDLEEVETDKARWYLSLPDVKDSSGLLESLQHRETIEAKRRSDLSIKKITSSKASLQKHQEANRHIPKIVSIDGISKDTDDEDGLIPYEKPDTDASDSDDDPTLIQRSKPSAPVYIKDLIAYLRDIENVDRYHLGITTAPSLIRRKAGFGTQLIECDGELALEIVSLEDKYKLPKFHEYRLQSMISLLFVRPMKMGPWFTITFFDADISQAQRSTILTALGLSARELAGYGDEDAQVIGLPALSDTAFPSKKLPADLHEIFSAESSPVDALTKRLSTTSLQPLAFNAASTLSGPDVLKVRKFSSRMEVERKRQQQAAQRKQKSAQQDLHKVLSEGYFYPLANRFYIMMQSMSTSSSYNPFLTPQLLRLFLQTLTLILSTLGPHTPSLPSLTREALTLLLSLHATPVSSEPIVLPALLTLFLAVIDINVTSGVSGEERLITDHVAAVTELREWTNDVFNKTSVGATDEDQVRIIAAGIMVKVGEVFERYQARLLGVNVGFKY